MKKTLAILASLTLITAVCAGVLAFVNSFSAPKITAAAAAAKNEKARAVMPETAVEVKTVKDSSGAEIAVGYAKDGSIAGYALEGSAKGYGGVVTVMAGFRPDLTLVGYEKIDAKETPGLGAKFTDPAFSAQFAGKDASKPLAVKKDGGEIVPITAATITSRAVCNAVNEAAARLKKHIGESGR